MTLVTMTRPDGSSAEVESNDAITVYGVDAQGAYLGLVAPSAAAAVASGSPPPGAGWRWASDAWVREISLAELKFDAIGRIDAAAGEARLRYITDVPGQVATYQMKETQARAFVADPTTTPVPPLVQAEADATGLTPLQAAQSIADTADAWIALVPVIERERRRGKCEVDAATTAADVETSAQAAIGVLATI